VASTLPRQRLPCPFHALERNRNAGAQFLREKRHAQFLEQPAKRVERRRNPSRPALGFRALAVAGPPGADLCRVALVAFGVLRKALEAPRGGLQIARQVRELRPRRGAEESGVDERVALRLRFRRCDAGNAAMRCDSA